MIIFVPEKRVEAVMKLFGFNKIQAQRHVQQEMRTQEILRLSPVRYPLGKSAMDS